MVPIIYLTRTGYRLLIACPNNPTEPCAIISASVGPRPPKLSGPSRNYTPVSWRVRRGHDAGRSHRVRRCDVEASPFVIVLSEEERWALEGIVRRGSWPAVTCSNAGDAAAARRAETLAVVLLVSPRNRDDPCDVTRIDIEPVWCV